MPTVAQIAVTSIVARVKARRGFRHTRVVHDKSIGVPPAGASVVAVTTPRPRLVRPFNLAGVSIDVAARPTSQQQDGVGQPRSVDIAIQATVFGRGFNSNYKLVVDGPETWSATGNLIGGAAHAQPSFSAPGKYTVTASIFDRLGVFTLGTAADTFEIVPAPQGAGTNPTPVQKAPGTQPSPQPAPQPSPQPTPSPQPAPAPQPSPQPSPTPSGGAIGTITDSYFLVNGQRATGAQAGDDIGVACVFQPSVSGNANMVANTELVNSQTGDVAQNAQQLTASAAVTQGKPYTFVASLGQLQDSEASQYDTYSFTPQVVEGGQAVTGGTTNITLLPPVQTTQPSQPPPSSGAQPAAPQQSDTSGVKDYWFNVNGIRAQSARAGDQWQYIIYAVFPNDGDAECDLTMYFTNSDGTVQPWYTDTFHGNVQAGVGYYFTSDPQPLDSVFVQNHVSLFYNPVIQQFVYDPVLQGNVLEYQDAGAMSIDLALLPAQASASSAGAVAELPPKLTRV